MMRIIVCTDIHGNAQALQSLLKTKDAIYADKIICLGDVVCMGPQPNEVIEMLKNDKRIITLMGNHDRWIAIEPPPSSKTCKVAKVKHHNYMKEITTEENLAYLKKLSYFYEFRVKNTKFYFTHYLWKNNFTEIEEHNEEENTPEKIKELFSRINANVIFYGHNHDAMEYDDNNKKYVCVGTLGMAQYGSYVKLTINDNGEYIIERKLLTFPRYKTLRIMKELKYPRFRLYGCYLVGFKNTSNQPDNDEDEKTKKNKLVYSTIDDANKNTNKTINKKTKTNNTQKTYQKHKKMQYKNRDFKNPIKKTNKY